MQKNKCLFLLLQEVEVKTEKDVAMDTDASEKELKEEVKDVSKEEKIVKEEAIETEIAEGKPG